VSRIELEAERRRLWRRHLTRLSWGGLRPVLCERPDGRDAVRRDLKGASTQKGPVARETGERVRVACDVAWTDYGPATRQIIHLRPTNVRPPARARD
jgi:hypothetical protein